MHDPRNGWIGLRRSAPNADWLHARLPFGDRPDDSANSAGDRNARVSVEGSQLAINPRGLNELLSAAKIIPWGDLTLAFSWLVIGLVAAYDTYLSVKFQETLPFLEVNPLCRMLIAADEGSVAMLLGFKFAGTVLSLGAILLVYQFKRTIGIAVASVVACLQGTLFVYLYLG